MQCRKTEDNNAVHKLSLIYSWSLQIKSNIYLSWASNSVFAHYLIRRLGSCRGNLFLSRPIWVNLCSHLWSCLHGSRLVKWNNTVGYLITWASDLGLCTSSGIVCRLGLRATWVNLAFVCDVLTYARELTDFKAFKS